MLLGPRRKATVSPCITAGGTLCGPMQVIWEGKSDRCEPSQVMDWHLVHFSNSHYKQAIKSLNPELEHTHTESHWATPLSVIALVTSLHKNYIVPTMQRLAKDPKKTKWLMLWDVHYSHRAQIVLEFLKATYPNLIIMFVPANCTTVLQPLDVLFNAMWKWFISQLCVTYLIALVSMQIQRNESVKILVSKVHFSSFFIIPDLKFALRRAFSWSLFANGSARQFYISSIPTKNLFCWSAGRKLVSQLPHSMVL